MTDLADEIATDRESELLIVADHAGNAVASDIELGVAQALLHDHIAVDLGVDPLARAIAGRLGCAALIARFSRLVVDLNRDPDEPNAVPESSDGHVIAGNRLSEQERAKRIARYWWPYHRRLAEVIDAVGPKLLINLHSFTPRLKSQPDIARPWEVGILYNHDDRAARVAIGLLSARGIVAGDNEPYSGRKLNATMNRHAETRGLPYLGLEVRQDLIEDAEGIERWAEILAEVALDTARALA